MRRILIVALAFCAIANAALAQSRPTGVPALNSRPEAAYTLYLNFAGFDFSGSWMGRGSPGATPAYANATGAFTAQQQDNIANIWARVAEKYAVFNVNVTTVDPALATLGPSASDPQRQAFYDSTPRLMHTVIGGSGSWLPNGGSGFSGMSTTRSIYATTANDGAGYGYHTNWVFAGQSGMNVGNVAEVTAHEHGHGLTLSHHCDCANGVIVRAYSNNFGAAGSGSYAPVMGSPFSAQRSTWRSGTADKYGIVIQNDVRSIMTNNFSIGGYVETGIGHSAATATVLPLSGSAVDPAVAKGIIVPASATDPNPIGASNYIADYFAFRTDGTVPLTLTAVNGGSRLTPGVADGGATLRSTLRILNAGGNVVATATEATNTLSSSFIGTLPAGRYFAEIASAGGFISINDPTAGYFDMGSYFLTGDGFSAARWTLANGGEWTAAGNWLGGVIPQPGEDAVIPVTPTAVRHSAGATRVRSIEAPGILQVIGGSLSVEGAVPSAIGTLSVSGPGAFIKSGPAAAGVSGSLTNTGAVAIQEGSLNITGRLAASSASTSAAAASGTLTVSAGASVTAASIRQSAVTSAGLVAVKPVAQGGETSWIRTLSLTGAGQLDLADARAVIATGGAAMVRQHLYTAYDNGTWAGAGITSSIARSDGLDCLAIGYATAAQLGVTSWGGLTGLTGVEVLTRLTCFGDANLDGRIDFDDFALVDRGLRSNLSGWIFGDFDYSGTIDASDAWLLHRGYILQGDPASTPTRIAMLQAQYGEAHISALLTSIPEPGSALAALFLAIPLGLRRRGRS